MTEIQVTQQWRIVGTAHAWEVQRFKGVAQSGKHKGKERWEALSYHQSLADAGQSLGARMVRTADAQGLEELVQEARRIEAILEAVMAPVREAGL